MWNYYFNFDAEGESFIDMVKILCLVLMLLCQKGRIFLNKLHETSFRKYQKTLIMHWGFFETKKDLISKPAIIQCLFLWHLLVAHRFYLQKQRLSSPFCYLPSFHPGLCWSLGQNPERRARSSVKVSSPRCANKSSSTSNRWPSGKVM